nr:hypothetical protein [Tanacetum cinerariifolium]
MEYLVKISKKLRILELKRRNIKKLILTSNTSYPSKKIWRICNCTSLKTKKEQDTIRLYYKMDNLRITMEEYIRLEEEKARRRGKVYNWENTTYASRSTLSGFIRIVCEQGSCGGQDMSPLPPRDQRHPWLRYQVKGYTEDIVHNYEQRLETIFGWSVNRLHVLDFAGVTKGMRQALASRLRMVYTGGLHTAEEMAKDGSKAYWLEDRHLRRHVEGRKSRARLSGGHFIGSLAAYFGLVSDEGLRGFLGTKEVAGFYAGAPKAAGDAHAVDEGAPADLETVPQRITRLKEEVNEIQQSIVRLRGDVDRLITDQSRFAT